MTRPAIRISLFGLGYVGCVSAACWARDGHEVIGVDVSDAKVEAINGGRSPVFEPDLAALVAAAVQSGRLRATGDPEAAVRRSDLTFLCVGTPSRADGRLDTSNVRRVCEQIGAALRGHDRWHTVVVRSTLAPGDTETVVVPALESASGRRAGGDFGVCYHPEFLREGCAVDDFTRPPRILVGEFDRRSGDAVVDLYTEAPTAIQRTTLRAAEMVKLVDNAFHALKVSFANEVGLLCKAAGADPHWVMKAVAEDARGNDAPTYLTPAFAFGGSCLPKDLRALTELAAPHDREPILLRAVQASNESHKQVALEIIRRSGRKRVGVLGLTFKPGTDDLRGSPAAELVARLVDEGYTVSVFDRHLALPELQGTNKAYAEHLLPQLSSLRRASMQAVLDESDLLVITHPDPQFHGVLERLRPGQIVVDLVRLREDGAAFGAQYAGICW